MRPNQFQDEACFTNMSNMDVRIEKNQPLEKYKIVY